MYHCTILSTDGKVRIKKIFSAYLGLGVRRLMQQNKKQKKKTVEQTSWIAIITTCCTDSSIDIMTWMYSE